MTILIIEDDPTDLKLFVEVLEGAGHRVIQTSAGEDAMLSLQRDKVDLILVDILLPGIDGLSLARQLKSASATQRIPILATSSIEDWPLERLARGAGCAGFVPKPVDTRALPNHVQKAIQDQTSTPI